MATGPNWTGGNHIAPLLFSSLPCVRKRDAKGSTFGEVLSNGSIKSAGRFDRCPFGEIESELSLPTRRAGDFREAQPAPQAGKALDPKFT